jgi:hypothetical protein
MEVLSFDNILGEQDIENLFESQEEAPDDTGEKAAEETAAVEESNETNKTTEVDPESLFEGDEEKPESVGSEKKEVQGAGDATTGEDSGTSPNANFYSSIANALAVDGIFPNLDEETIKKANDAESFSDLIEAEINARLDEKQQRISKALENGVEPTDIRRYETVLNNLSRITDAAIAEESEKGEQLRRDIIYQDFINRGYKPEVAQKRTERIIDGGTDIEDAKEALQSNRDFFQSKYDELLEDARVEADKVRAERQRQEAKLKKDIMEDKQLMGGMTISNDVRKKVYENISKPVYKDPETGQYLTALQKYEAEHHGDFLKFASLFYTLTDGFKDFKSFAKAEVKKEMKKGLRDLEQTLSNTRRASDGSLRMVTSVKDDKDSYFGSGMRLDL